MTSTKTTFTDQPLTTVDGRPIYDNTPTVVCVLLVHDNRLLTIRRADGLKTGLLALPGGHQMRRETWQQAGARELYEETGWMVDPNKLELLDVVTDEYEKNVLFCRVHALSGMKDIRHRLPADEVSELVWFERGEDEVRQREIAFGTHFEKIYEEVWGV